MTDMEILIKYERIWYNAENCWEIFIKSIPTKDLIRIAIVDDIPSARKIDLEELKTRTDVPEEMKLEVLLLLGDL